MVDQAGLVRPLFKDGPRTDDRQAGFNESRHDFLDRSSWPYADAVRSLLVSWLLNVPDGPQNDLIGRLKSSDDQHESAFWELYLHEAYRRSGHRLEFHPSMQGTSRNPDFLVTSPAGAFYLEATSPRESDNDAAADRRLAEVHDVLHRLETTDFYIGLFDRKVGAASLSTRRLRGDLRRWLAGLDAGLVAQQMAANPVRTPRLTLQYGDWTLEFHALPRSPENRATPRPALGMLGHAEAVLVDNSSPLVKAIERKASSYGDLPHPLVVAVLANSESPTWDYQVERALFGASDSRPSAIFVDTARFFESGVWASSAGWMRPHVPQVVCCSDLSYRTLGTTIPRLWSSLDERAVQVAQPGWLARVVVEGPDPVANEPAVSISEHLGIESPWLLGTGLQQL